MTERQKRFCDEYLRDCNGTRAYRVAYPHIKNDASACTLAGRLLGKVEVKDYLAEQMEALRSVRIAEAREVLEYLTSVLRGEATAEIVVTEGQGMGISRARTMQKHPDMKERLKAAELLAKYHQLLVPRVQIEAERGGGVIVLAEAVDGEP